MKSWFCIPSARPVAEVIPVVAKWQQMGYGVALQRDNYPPTGVYGDSPILAQCMIFIRKYEGYAEAVNFLSRHVLRMHPEVDWIVTAGDDTFPDPNKTGDEVADELTVHFDFESQMRILRACREKSPGVSLDDLMAHPPEWVLNFPGGKTFGVCQPTGDRWADSLGVIIERIAGSPWLGREWCRRAHGGLGPFWPEFTHMFGDEALQLYAQSLGVFLQRPDLTHYHAHAQRVPGTDKTRNAPAPAHMAQWNTRKHWDESKAIFERLKSTNFAECQPIP